MATRHHLAGYDPVLSAPALMAPALVRAYSEMILQVLCSCLGVLSCEYHVIHSGAVLSHKTSSQQRRVVSLMSCRYCGFAEGVRIGGGAFPKFHKETKGSALRQLRTSARFAVLFSERTAEPKIAKIPVPPVSAQVTGDRGFAEQKPKS